MNEINWNEVKEEAVELLSKLIQFDTTNPPGNELPACEFLKKQIEVEGVHCVLEETDKNRGNLYAEIEGEDPPLILLNHLDVVGASEDGWVYPPFSGKVDDNYIWGRGAIDCKGLTIMELMVFKLLRRREVKLRRSVIFCATADEEMGGKKGAYLAAEKLSNRLREAIVINEGGVGIKGFIGGKDTFLPDFAEKGPVWLELEAKGEAGHASTPHEKNPNLKLVKALNALMKKEERFRVIPPLKKALDLLKEELPVKVRPLITLLKVAPSFLLRIVASRNPRIAALLRNTYTLTILKGGYKENVIPSSSKAVVDIRILPGEDPEKTIVRVRELCKRYEVEVNVLTQEEPSFSEPDTKVMKTIKEVIKKKYPECVFFPLMTPGFTDSRFFRKKGAIAYGFMPLLFTQEELDTIHGVNERISIEALLEGIRNLFDIVVKLAV